MWLAPPLGRFIRKREIRYPFCRRRGWLLGRSGRVRKIRLHRYSRTFQLVATRYTDYAIPAHNCCPTGVKLFELYHSYFDILLISCSLHVYARKKHTLLVTRVRELFYKAADRILTHCTRHVFLTLCNHSNFTF